MKKPLEGIIVLEFSQFMAGPSAGLRLADLGARVIKIERPKTGEAGRQIATKNMFQDGSSLVFHTTNRNKESYAANLKSPEDLEKIKKLISKADVITHNFRPGVMEKIGLRYEQVKEINPRLIYATITGYGTKGEWKSKPGQDLLVQSLSGLTQLTGNNSDAPTPMGVAVVDMLCGTHFVQGIIAALIQRAKTNKGTWVAVNLLESAIDFQLEILTTYLNNGQEKPVRSETNNAHVLLQAPYGLYQTSDGYIAIAMGKLTELFNILKISETTLLEEPFENRNEIKEILAKNLINQTADKVLNLLQSEEIWCSVVNNYHEFLNSKEFEELKMRQEVKLQNGKKLSTTRCPIRINGQLLNSETPAPRVGEHSEKLNLEFEL
ncbi:CaiB/BaiF CoA transferase family protein [Arcticibacterium luteifluviistationis]|uniref:Carnitine dehydratase n=1 Tax=Arcticibacterium luteifluviistationis TaxID=1784714 RepID=A0A2Z4G6K1_9BACT|nr:CoA transferase [Arcticibacterium luteifluviistationis]AWV96740.1 carnitine dehydratase [Arcticibacterium luteifluviistationis]